MTYFLEDCWTGAYLTKVKSLKKTKTRKDKSVFGSGVTFYMDTEGKRVAGVLLVGMPKPSSTLDDSTAQAHDRACVEIARDVIRTEQSAAPRAGGRNKAETLAMNIERVDHLREVANRMYTFDDSAALLASPEIFRAGTTPGAMAATAGEDGKPSKMAQYKLEPAKQANGGLATMRGR